MREIKLRVWQPEQKQFYYWSVGDNADNFNEVATYYKSNPQQFTGLLDKQGKEIYEGDILLVGYEPTRDENENGEEIDSYTETWKQEVKWSPSGVVLYAPTGHDFWGEFSSTTLEWATGDGEYEVEAIGNIYENPELLK